MTGKITLYHHGSSACAAKVRFVLAEKGIGWDSGYVDILAGEQFAPEFLALNPKAVVPVLVHHLPAGDAIISKSTVICEYAEDAFPDTPRLMPADPVQRAAVRIWTKGVDEELHPACSALTYLASHRHAILASGRADNFDTFLAAPGSEGRAARELKFRWIREGFAAPGAAEKLQLYVAWLDRMEQALGSTEWLVGDSFTLADAALAPYLNRLAALAMERLWLSGTRPNVARWFDAVRSRPSFVPAFVAWMPPELTVQMRENGNKSWLEVERLLAVF